MNATIYENTYLIKIIGNIHKLGNWKQTLFTLIMVPFAKILVSYQKYVLDLWNHDEVHTVLAYFDVSNLYGETMIQKVPTHGFMEKKVDAFTFEKIAKLERIYFRNWYRLSQDIA